MISRTRTSSGLSPSGWLLPAYEPWRQSGRECAVRSLGFSVHYGGLARDRKRFPCWPPISARVLERGQTRSAFM